MIESFEILEELKLNEQMFGERPVKEQIFIQEDQTVYVKTESGWEKKPQELFNYSLYDMNKQIISQMPPHTEEDLLEDRIVIDAFYNNNIGNYYLLLNNELHYYTVFTVKDFLPDCPSLGAGVIECFNNLGPIYGIDTYEDRIEIWSKVKDEMFVFLLFNYDNGVVTIGG